jgi:signal transduction histidine kinase
MTPDLLKYIFLLLIGTSILNFFITLVMKIQNKQKELNTLLVFWPALMLAIIGASVLDANPIQMALAYFIQMIPSNIMAQIMCSHQKIKTHWKYIIGIQLAAITCTTFLLLYTKAGFTASMIPVYLSSSLPFICPIWFVLVKNRKKSNWIEIGISLVILVGILNLINYAFFPLDPIATNIGWSISIAQYQCLSLFLPLLIIDRKKDYQFIKESNFHLKQERDDSHLFVRTISHDLATPLTVIKTYTDMLLAGKIDEENHNKIWQRIKLNVNSAQNMMFQINKIISNKQQAELVPIKPTCLKSCLEELHELFAMQLTEKQIDLNIKYSIGTDTKVMADQGSLTHHVLANIMSNAIKFSYRNNHIQINVEESDQFVIVNVRDFGIGMNQEASQIAILQSRPGTEGESGTGFGLMSLNYFVRKFQGEFHVLSTSEMQGTLIKLKLLKA